VLISHLKTDFYTTIEKALSEIDPNYKDYEGVIITGSHAPEDVEAKIDLIKYARENKVPFLGVCMGMQLMAIEFMRSKDYDAISTEITPNPSLKQNITVQKLPELRVGIKPVTWKGETRNESHWHNYAVSLANKTLFETSGWEISYTEGVPEIMQLKDHPFFLGTQFHPEYQSDKQNPHPLLKEFIEACKKN